MWGFLIFAIAYVICFPAFVLGLRYMRDQRSMCVLSTFLAKLWMLGSGLRWRARYEQPLDKGEAYVFCANHSSYLDVPTLFTIDSTLVFVGKSSLRKVPLFGYMYKHMHIVVDRGSLRSRGSVLLRAREVLQNGRSLAFFPEGGIRSKEPPRMARFYEGAFRVAIEAQKPLVPVTILYNWMILPKYRCSFVEKYRHLLDYYVHRPISTQGMTMDQLPQLMDQVRARIDSTLSQHFMHALSK